MRLTNILRTEIIKAVLIKAFSRRQKRLLSDFNKIGDEIYRELVTESLENKVKSLPTGWADTSGSYCFSCSDLGGDVKTGDLSSLLIKDFVTTIGCKANSQWRLYVPFSKQRKWPDAPSQAFHEKEPKKSIAKIKKLIARAEKIHDEAKAMRSELAGIVYGVTTIKSLVKLWPDASEYLPKAEQKMQLPIVKPNSLNAMIKRAAKQEEGEVK